MSIHCFSTHNFVAITMLSIPLKHCNICYLHSSFTQNAFKARHHGNTIRRARQEARQSERNRRGEARCVGKNCASAFCRFKFDFAVSWCGQKPFNINFIILLPVWQSCRSYTFTSSCDCRDYCFISAVLNLVSVIVGYNSRVP